MNNAFARPVLPSGSSDANPPIRIPVRGNVPAGHEVRSLVDSAAVQRLRGVRQLGLAHLVYPGAVHTRFEHSLGVYAVGRLILGELASRSPRVLSPEDERCFLACCLLHDVGHYPFSHTLEDLPPDPQGRVHIIRHDERARAIIMGDRQVPGILRGQWGCDPDRICRVIDELSTEGDTGDARLRRLLAGPLNPDRLDYLERDSQHVGVPYGRAIDMERLLATVRFVPDGSELCVLSKGVSAVETLIFASYLMYREVYWHHAVRAAQAMLKRAVTEAVRSGRVLEQALVALDDGQALALLQQEGDSATTELMAGLGSGRGIYRRVYSGSVAEAEELPTGACRDVLLRLARANHWEAEEVLAAVIADFNRATGHQAKPHDLLYDASGRDKELFFTVPVLWSDGRLRSTAEPEVSLLAPSLAVNFERHAKRQQLLARPALVRDLATFLGLGLDKESVVPTV